MSAQDVDVDALIRGRGSRKRWLLLAGIVGIVAVAAISFVLVRPGESEVVVEPQAAEATSGQLTTTIDLSGSAAAAQSSNLTFGIAGDVVAVDVEAGDEVTEGQVLARFDTSQLQLAVEEAELTLQLRQAELDELPSGGRSAAAVAADVASANQTIASAEARVADAQAAVDALMDGPTAADVAASSRDLAAKQIALVDKQDALAELEAGPPDEQIASADLAVARAEADVLQTAETLAKASNQLGLGVTLASIIAGDSSAPGEVVVQLLLSDPGDVLVLQATESAATAQFEVARNSLKEAYAARDELMAGPSASDLAVARQEVELAKADLADAQAADAKMSAWWLASRGRGSFDEGDLATEVQQAQLELASAKTSLTRAQADRATLFEGVSSTDQISAELAVTRAEQALEQARADLAAATMVAPFDGVIESVEVGVGDSVAANTAAFVLTNRDRIVVDLTVTESDLLDLEPGQVGLATFDAIDGIEYPVRITSVSRVPTSSQGVVTYAVEAEVLVGQEIADVADQIAVLNGDGSTGGGFAGGQNGFEGGAGGRAGGLFSGIELPEGVTIQDVLQALANDEPLPEGVTLPEGFEVPEQLLERIRSGQAPGGFADGQGAGPQADAATARPMPAPGMSASVTILTDVRDEAVLVPTSAVRQLDDEYFVTVPAADGGTERVIVEVGETDGTNVEILSGLEAGDTVLIGADSEGIAFSATRQGQQQLGGTEGGGLFFGGGGRFAGDGPGGAP